MTVRSQQLTHTRLPHSNVDPILAAEMGLRGEVIKRPFAVPTAHAHRRLIGRWAWAAGWALARLSALPSAHAHRSTIRDNKKLVSVTC